MEHKKQKKEYRNSLIGVAIAFVMLLQAPFVYAVGEYLPEFHQIYAESVSGSVVTFATSDYTVRNSVNRKGTTENICNYPTDDIASSGLSRTTDLSTFISSGNDEYVICFSAESSQSFNFKSYFLFNIIDGDVVVPSEVIPDQDGFIITVTNPNDVVVGSEYDYQGENFDDFLFELNGVNNLGLYDNFYIDVYQDGASLVDNYEVPITISCSGCLLGDFYLSDLGVSFSRYHKYYFNITMGSIIAEPIVKDFILFYDIASEIINYDDCSTGDFFCYIKNGFKWAFTIPPSTWQKFIDLKNIIETKPPFGYGTQAYNALLGIDGTAEANFEIQQSEPINDLIFTPIRTAMSWFLYFIFLVALVKRFMHIQI